MTASDLEARLRELERAGDMRGVATLAIREYGPEILGYLYAVARAQQTASEVFSIFLEDIWRGLPGFAWESSFRTWAYAVARNALLRHLRAEERVRRAVPLSDAPEIFEVAERVRTTTLVHLRSETRDKARRLREQLTPDEQTLLILRIDRRMTWAEIAAVVGEGDAALRKRFERIVARLRKVSRAEK